ncbi:MAG: hypothetical protein ACT443_00190 [Gemmatimonadota bacterium]
MTTRPGIALVLVLLVLLLIEVLAAGMLALATQARLLAAAQMRSARADAAAHDAIRSVLAAWDSAQHDTLPPGVPIADPAGSGTREDASWSATVERLSSGTFVIRALSEVGAASAFSTARALAVARTLDRAAVLRDFNTAVASGGVTVLAGSTNVSAAQHQPPGWTSDQCEPSTVTQPDPFALLTAVLPVVGPSATVTGPAVVDTTAFPPDSIALGGVRWSELEHIADRLETGTVWPSPAGSNGACDELAAANWGDPGAPGAPCGRYFPLIFSNGDLRIAGGAGQGILAVAGALTMDAGATFFGVVVARDGISVDRDAVVYGSIRSAGGAALFAGGALLYSRCAIATALSLSAATRRIVPQHRTFLPAF